MLDERTLILQVLSLSVFVSICFTTTLDFILETAFVRFREKTRQNDY